jgi:hypothetical protein
MKITGVMAAICMLAAMTPGHAVTAHADTGPQFFASPSGNISCQLYLFQANTGSAACQIRDSTFAAPPRPPNCQGGWGDSIGLVQGKAATFGCHTDTLFGGSTPALPYGATRTIAGITCDSEPTGMTCRDTTTGHYFQLSRDSYQLG